MLLLRAKSSINEELKKENNNINEVEDNINIYRKKPPIPKKKNNDLKGSSRHLNDQNETEKSEGDENEETPRIHPTSEKIIKSQPDKSDENEETPHAH